MSFVNENIRILRNRMGLTQEKLAELSGINRKVIGSYEEGRATPPLENLNTFANLFEITIDELSFHRFAEDETPLFKSDKPAVDTSRRRSLRKPQTKDTSDLYDFSFNTIPYISYKYFDKYILDSTFTSKIDKLPVFTIPFVDTEEELRAFDVPADAGIADGIVMGKRFEINQALIPEAHYLLVTTTKGIVLDQIKTIDTEVVTINNGSFAPKDLKEIWEVFAYYSKQLPAAGPDLNSLKRKVNLLKDELDKFL